MPTTTTSLSPLDLQLIFFIVLMVCTVLLTMIFYTRSYLIRTCGKCTSDRSMLGKVVIITGSNTGIGKEAAKDLVRRGAKVILACRSLEKALTTVDEIRAACINPAQVIGKQCDLSSLKSVRNFADDILASEERLDVLICNAGSGCPPGRHLTEDGFERQFQTNHLGHFLLINLLLPLLESTPAATRIVITSSLAHRFGRIDLKNIAFADRYSNHPLLTYCDTKLLNVILTKQLSRRLCTSSVTVNALHPGTIYTNGIRYNKIWYVKLFLMFMCWLYGQRTVEQGAQTIIHLAVAEEVTEASGLYFADCRPANYNPLADDQSLADQIWNLSYKLAGLQ